MLCTVGKKKSHAVQANVQVRDIRCFYGILQLNSIYRTHDFGCQKTDKWQRTLDNDTALALARCSQRRGHQAGVGGAPNLATRPETADGESTTTSSAVHEGTSDSHMPSQIRHVAKRIRTRPTSAPGTTGTPTRPPADARTGPPNEYRAFTPCNCRCSLSPTFESKLRKGQKEMWLAVKVFEVWI